MSANINNIQQQDAEVTVITSEEEYPYGLWNGEKMAKKVNSLHATILLVLKSIQKYEIVHHLSRSKLDREKWKGCRISLYLASGPLYGYRPFSEGTKCYSTFRNNIYNFLRILNDEYEQKKNKNEEETVIHNLAHQLFEGYDEAELQEKRNGIDKKIQREQTKATKEQSRQLNQSMGLVPGRSSITSSLNSSSSSTFISPTPPSTHRSRSRSPTPVSFTVDKRRRTNSSGSAYQSAHDLGSSLTFSGNLSMPALDNGDDDDDDVDFMNNDAGGVNDVRGDINDVRGGVNVNANIAGATRNVGGANAGQNNLPAFRPAPHNRFRDMIDNIDNGITISNRAASMMNNIMNSNRFISVDQTQALNSVTALFTAVPNMANNQRLTTMAEALAMSVMQNSINGNNNNNNNLGGN